MNKLLEMATITVDIKMRGNYLTQVCLNWQNVFEVRSFRLSLSKQGYIYLQPPATGQSDNKTWFKCFIVKDKDQWHELQNTIINQFLTELEEKVNEGIYAPKILEAMKVSAVRDFNEVLSEKDLEEIDKAITNNHL